MKVWWRTVWAAVQALAEGRLAHWDAWKVPEINILKPLAGNFSLWGQTLPVIPFVPLI